MTRPVMRVVALGFLLALALVVPPATSQEPGRDQRKAAVIDKREGKADAALIAQLIKDLGSSGFETREKATRQLSELAEVPELLRAAISSADPEVSRRARKAVTTITVRNEERAFQAMMKDLHKVELDRLVRVMVTNKERAGEAQWKIIQAITKAVTKEANKLAGRTIDVPDFAVATMPHLLYDHQIVSPVAVIRKVLLSTGPTPYITAVHNALIIVDGDFEGATGIDRSLLIVRGNIGRVTSATNSIILATGSWEGATGCDNCFVQINNHRIRYTGSRDSVFVNTRIRTTGRTTSRTLETDRGPLQLVNFIPRKTDAQLVWGKEVNNLAVAITPADRKGQFLIRWKNVGKEEFSLPWTRFNHHSLDKDRDDLLNHVFLKGPDGKLVAARKYPDPTSRVIPILTRTVVLGPGRIHEEIIDLSTYLEKPETGKRYRLSIELDIAEGRRGQNLDVKPWIGKIQSNVLEVVFDR